MKYIDKVETEITQSIEAFMGSLVHETLEKLYRDLQYEKLNSLDELITYLRAEWEKQWDDSIVIVKEEYGPDNYLKMAERLIKDYYKTYEPFDQSRTISIEERIMVNLDECSDDYKLQGYIDRLNEKEEGYYEIHDYKTNARLPTPQAIENDRQLALYSIGVKNRYPDVKKVRLIWHFLAFNKEIYSSRTEAELNALKQQTRELIDTIENDQVFKTNPSGLCNWCEFKPICPQFAHLYTIKEKTEDEYGNDSGIQLVDRYDELKNKKNKMTKEINKELKKVEHALIDFSKKEKIEVVYGSKKRVRIKDYERYKFPAKKSNKRKELVKLLKENRKWNEVTQLDTAQLNKIIQNKEWNGEILNLCKEYVQLEKSKRFYLRKIKQKN